MAAKEDALLLSATTLFNTNPLYGFFANGIWNEVTGTKLEILASHLVTNENNPLMAFVSNTFTIGTNSVATIIQNAAFSPSADRTFNRWGVLRGGRALGPCSLTNLAGLELTLNTAATIDWQIGDTVYFNNQTTAIITDVDDVAKTIDIDAVPSGVTASSTLMDGFGELVDAKAISTKTLTGGINNVLNETITLVGS